MKSLLSHTILAGILVGYSNASLASPQWVLLNNPKASPRIYVERESTTQGLRTHSVKVWFMLDYDQVQGSGRNAYLSLKAQNEYDCDLDESKFITQTTYSGRAGRGEVISINPQSNPAWKKVLPKSIGAVIISDVCRR